MVRWTNVVDVAIGEETGAAGEDGQSSLPKTLLRLFIGDFDTFLGLVMTPNFYRSVAIHLV